jgi:sigma-54 specific flagellar transcriptional regulator A
VIDTEGSCSGSVICPATSSSAPAAAESPIVGESHAIAGLRRMVRQVAPSDASVLLVGPSGSGKEVVARAIHARSKRAAKPFVAINCGAIPRDLLESELFGHEKGSFTGAFAQHKGRFEEAHSGTLFLDEIGDMPADMQVKLLRVLEERVVQRVGGRGQIAVDVRILAATHRDIDAAIEAGSFREDLYYRLAVFPIELPALADHVEDVPLLVAHFLGQCAGRKHARFTPAAFERMRQHGWPGNVRELRNFVERANILHGGRTLGRDEAAALLLRRGRVGAIEREALWDATDVLAGPAPAALPAAAAAIAPAPAPSKSVAVPIRAGTQAIAMTEAQPVALRDMLAEIERRYIEEALTQSEGVIADAARLLSLQRTTLIEKMRKYEMRAA